MPTLELTHPPSLPRLFASSLLPRIPGWAGGTTPNGLPELEVTLPRLSVDPAELAAYNRVCDLRMTGTLPATYLHILAFPLSVRLMTDASFPYPLVGLVHLANRMTQHRPVGVAEKLALRVRTGRLRPLDSTDRTKGAVFDVLAEVRVADELVWSGESSYLRRGEAVDESAAAGDLPDSLPGDTASGELTPPTDAGVAIWQVPGDIGRRYGRVSGDVNPIHLSPLSARLFGFPRAIAHGMWSHAKALGAFEGRLPERFVADVRFQKPLLLPSTVAFAVFDGPGGTGSAFTVRNADNDVPHLAGTLREA